MLESETVAKLKSAVDIVRTIPSIRARKQRLQ